MYNPIQKWLLEVLKIKLGVRDTTPFWNSEKVFAD